MFKKICFITIILIFISQKSYSNNNIYIAASINEEILTNFDIQQEVEYLKILNPQLNQLEDNKILKIARNSLINETVKKIELKKFFILSEELPLINEIFQNFYQKLGFSSEKEKLFEKYESKKLRPDFYKKVGKTGILMEVEKGKTVTNNMDLLDLWKCHICSEANHLFLIIPIRDEAKGLNIFDTVCKRMSSFFVKENYLNINSLVIFGY